MSEPMNLSLYTFNVPLSETQKEFIDMQFSAACKKLKTERAAMIGQPFTKMPGIPVIHMKKPYIQINVISPKLFDEIQAVLKSAGGAR